MNYSGPKLFSAYHSMMANGDPRLANWPMMQSPFPTMGLCLLYVYFVKTLGPELMKNRKVLDLRVVMVLYNFFMVIASAAIVYLLSKYAWFNGYSFKCQPVDYSNSPEAMVIVKVSYAYYILKFVEFLDTIFFVLRKKNSQVSTLHVIHHGIMPFSVWWGLKFVPGGHATFFGYINSLVHVIMYIYYGLAAMGPQFNKYLWWKKYLTVFQMVQFIMIFAHSIQLLFRDCNFPKLFGIWIGAHGVLFWFLFSNFYRDAYTRKKSLKETASNLASCCSPHLNQSKEHQKHHLATNGNVEQYKNGLSLSDKKRL